MSICLIFHLAWLSHTLCRSSVSFYRVLSSHQVLSKHLNKFRQSCVLVPEVSSLHVTTCGHTAKIRSFANISRIGTGAYAFEIYTIILRIGIDAYADWYIVV